jgi:hypothetical protein
MVSATYPLRSLSNFLTPCEGLQPAPERVDHGVDQE